MEISTFQGAGHNLYGALTWHTVNSALIVNYDELNRIIGSLTAAVYFFCDGPKGGAHGTIPPLNTVLAVPISAALRQGLHFKIAEVASRW